MKYKKMLQLLNYEKEIKNYDETQLLARLVELEASYNSSLSDMNYYMRMFCFSALGMFVCRLDNVFELPLGIDTTIPMAILTVLQIAGLVCNYVSKQDADFLQEKERIIFKYIDGESEKKEEIKIPRK